MPDTKSGEQFLQRIGVLDYNNAPTPQIEPRAHRVHSMPLTVPLPLANYRAHYDGEPSPPDRGVTGSWPHPE